jgi:tetratricopeptide (TPR) repeat protein
MPADPTLLARAVEAAQSGQREQARRLFLRVVEQDQRCLEAWIYLSRLVDDPEDQFVALENALILAPHDEELRARREAVLLAHPYLHPSGLPSEQRDRISLLYRQSLMLEVAGKHAGAARLLRQILEINPRELRAWIKLSEIDPDPAERTRALEKVLALDPLNEDALVRRQQLLQLQSDPLKRGRLLESRGEFEQAVEIYRSVTIHSRSAADRVEAACRIEDIRLRQESHNIQPVNPHLDLWRMTLGPVILFAIMVFMQSGMKMFHIPLLAWPGLASVFAGSLLVSVTAMRPAPPKWIELFGRPGSGDEPEWRRGLCLLGWALLLAPYTMFLIEAGYRLGVLQASMLADLP